MTKRFLEIDRDAAVLATGFAQPKRDRRARTVLAPRMLLLCLATPCAAGGCLAAESGDGPDASPRADAQAQRAPDSGAVSDATGQPEARGNAVVEGTGGVGLNLRAGPSVETEILAAMPDRTILDLRGDPEGDFWPVTFRDTEGWAADAFLDIYADGDVPALSDGYNFLLPWRDGVSFRVSQGHSQGSHTGINEWAWDFALPVGTPVVASHAGTVRSVQTTSNGSGCDPVFATEAKHVTLDRGDGLESHYVHLDTVAVTVGQQVERGEVVGTSGETGYVCGAHLHFQIQLSPDGGGGTSGANQSVQSYFWDTGTALDPAPQTDQVSRNGSADIP